MMFDQRNRQLDVAAIGLAAGSLFLAMSLWSYDTADPPAGLVYPPPPEIANAGGRIGAYLAHSLLQTLGIGAYYLLATMVAVSLLLFARRTIDQLPLRAAGWGISMIGLTTLAALLLPSWSPGPVIGAGGYIGAAGRAWLEVNFAHAGSLLFAMSVMAAGLLLATDYFFLHLFAATTVVSSRGLKAAAIRMRPKTDLEGPILADGEEEEDEDDEDEEWEYVDEEEEDEEDEWDEDEDNAEITIRTPDDRNDKQGSKEGAASKTGGSALRRVASRLSSALGGDAQESTTEEDATAAEAADDASSDTATKNGPRFKTPQPQSEREEIIQQLEAADHTSDPAPNYELPSLELLEAPEEFSYQEHEKEVRRKAKVLEKTFQSFGLNVRVVEIETGPVIAQYEVQLEAGLRLAKITGLADDLAIALRVPSVRIVAPIPGKNTVGIEVPNEHRQLVRLREVIEETNGKAARMKIPIYLGKDVAGNPMVVDLASLPHLLIAGRTGTGKSVCLNSIIVSMLMGRGPDEVRMLMIDPKMVELSGYRKLPHLMHPVVTDMKKAEAILAWAVDKMEERYQLLARAGVRHVSVYNQLGDEELRERVQPTSEAEWEEIPRQLPFIVIVADEMADLMMTAGKDVEQHIIRLAQKSRAVGIHLILATQKPTVDVITGLIKSNLPARIAFQVASRTDSRVVLDEMGADKLLGNGDMLFLSPGTSVLLRGQGTFLSDDEINRVVDFVGTDEPQFAGELMQLKTQEEVEATAGSLKNRDEMYEAAIEVVVREGRGSVSLLQRALGIGYGRAARLIDFMAEDGIVGQYNGSQAREVTITMAEWEAMRDDPPATSSPPTASSSPMAGSSSPRANRFRYDSEEEDAEDSTEAPAEIAEDSAAEDGEWDDEEWEEGDEEWEEEDEEWEEDEDEDDVWEEEPDEDGEEAEEGEEESADDDDEEEGEEEEDDLTEQDRAWEADEQEYNEEEWEEERESAV